MHLARGEAGGHRLARDGLRNSNDRARPAKQAARTTFRSNAEDSRPHSAREPSSSPFNSGRKTRAQRVPAIAILAGSARTRVPPFMSTSLSRASFRARLKAPGTMPNFLPRPLPGNPTR